MNNIRIIIRTILKPNNFTIIGVISLAIALSLCMALMSKVLYVSSFDKFYPDYKRIDKLKNC